MGNLGDVRVHIEDGGLGLSTVNSDGIHVKIGVSTAEKNKMTVINSTMKVDKIREKLGYSPLTNACLDSIQAGAGTMYCIPTEGTIPGEIGQIKFIGSGEAGHKVIGKPNNDYEIVLEILSSGALNEATYRYSIDGGDSFTGEKTIPMEGKVEVYNTGLTIEFTESVEPTKSFVTGDIYTFRTTAPKMSNQEVLEALEVVQDLTLEFEYIHIVGESDMAMWAAVAAKTDNLFNTYFKPVFAVCEARNKKEGESLDEYVQSLIQARNKVTNYRLQIVAARSEMAALDGTTRDSNGGGIITGLYPKAKVSRSIGEVREFPLNSVIKLKPEGIEPYIPLLDEAKFVTFRKYIGLEGFYVTNARMAAIDGSDYQYAEIVRTANKAVREIRKQSLFNMQIQIDPTDVDGTIEEFREFIQIPLERMVEDKEIVSGRIIIPEGQDILGTSKIKVKAKVVPMAILREIEVEFAMENPFRKSA